MKQLNGGSLEFNFYFADLVEPEPFRRVVQGLLDLGARFGGEGLVAKGKGINDQPFADTFDPEPEQVDIKDEATFFEMLSDPDRRLIEVVMPGAIYLEQNLAERVTYLSIPQKAAFSNNHPIAIWSLWDSFDGIPEDYFEPKSKANHYRQLARKKGREVYRRFVALLDLLKPTYAAITMESFLGCPADLRVGKPSNLFRDFYLSTDYFSGDFVKVKELYREAYFEELTSGLYISGYEYFNPAGKNLDFVKLSEYSAEVGKLIGSRVG